MNVQSNGGGDISVALSSEFYDLVKPEINSLMVGCMGLLELDLELSIFNLNLDLNEK